MADVTIGGCLGHSNHKIIDFDFWRNNEGGQQDSQRAGFGLFMMLVDKDPWDAVLRGKGVQEGWT